MARPVPPNEEVGMVVVLDAESLKESARSCSNLSWQYSEVRAARCPWFSLVARDVAARAMTPAATTNIRTVATMVSIRVEPLAVDAYGCDSFLFLAS
jgi:hypothetical protein